MLSKCTNSTTSERAKVEEASILYPKSAHVERVEVLAVNIVLFVRLKRLLDYLSVSNVTVPFLIRAFTRSGGDKFSSLCSLSTGCGIQLILFVEAK
jgi:hypothetical protein